MILATLAPLGAHHLITIIPVYDGDNVTVTVLFKAKAAADKPRPPLQVSGTIAEVDAYLIEELPGQVTELSGLVSNIAEVKAAAAADAEAAKAKPTPAAATSTPAKSGKKKKKASAPAPSAPKPPEVDAPAPAPSGGTPALVKPKWVAPEAEATPAEANPLEVDFSFLDE